MGSEFWSQFIMELLLSDQLLGAEIFGYDRRENFNLQWEALLEFRR
jgi:hypothetical protein